MITLLLQLSYPSIALSEKIFILARDQWNAKQPVYSRMQKQIPREIVIHHTAVRQQPTVSLKRKMLGLQGYSQVKKGWGDVPYHFYIGVSGRIAEGRNIYYAGDTNTRYSIRNRVQIVLEGHFDRERPNRKQLRALERLVTWLSRKYGIRRSRISGHNDHVSTSCPGRYLSAYLPKLRKRRGASGE